MIVKVVVPDSIYARVYFARGEQGPQGVTGNTGPQGPSGIVNVDSPITNSGTTTAANIGLNQALIQIAPAQVTGTAVITTDSRLSDQRVPTDGSVTDTKIVAGGLSPNRITGTAVITTDSRLSDARAPLAHAATHGSAGSDPVTLAQSQVTNLVSDLAAKAPIDSPVFTTKVTLPVTSGTFLGTNSLGEIYKVGGAPGLGYVPYTASVGGGIAWQELAKLVKTDSANTFTVGGHTITSESASVIPLVLKGASGQTGNLFELKNNAGTNLVQVNSAGLTSFTRATTITQLNADVSEAHELTDRLKADMGSDSWLSKNIRPLTLISILVGYFIFAFMSSQGHNANEKYVELLGQWGMLIMSFYFGGRTLEKIIALKK